MTKLRTPEIMCKNCGERLGNVLYRFDSDGAFKIPDFMYCPKCRKMFVFSISLKEIKNDN